METPKEHIEHIRETTFSIGREKNPLAPMLDQAVKYLSAELYAKDVHFLMELIQVSFSFHFLFVFVFLRLIMFMFSFYDTDMFTIYASCCIFSFSSTFSSSSSYFVSADCFASD